MPWDEDEQMGQIRIESERGEIPKESDPLFSSREKAHLKKFRLPDEMPIGLISVVILALVVLFILFIPGSKRAKTDKKIAYLEAQVSQLADRVSQMETSGKEMLSQEALDQKNEKILKRIERVETSLSMVTKQMEEKLAELKAPPKKPEARKEAAGKKEAKPAAEKSAYHVVQPGDTLFSISRQYSIKPDEIKRLNKLSGEQIYPGQQLKVSGN